jgi:hypothetical protein
MPVLPNPLRIQFKLPEKLAPVALKALDADANTKKARTISLQNDGLVQIDLLQPGSQTASRDVFVTCAVDLPALIAPGGFTSNVIRPFIGPLLVHEDCRSRAGRVARFRQQRGYR